MSAATVQDFPDENLLRTLSCPRRVVVEGYNLLIFVVLMNHSEVEES
jgi:hypothetical protein